MGKVITSNKNIHVRYDHRQNKSICQRRNRNLFYSSVYVLFVCVITHSIKEEL